MLEMLFSSLFKKKTGQHKHVNLYLTYYFTILLWNTDLRKKEIITINRILDKCAIYEVSFMGFFEEGKIHLHK